ncbi:MAG: LamG domain-containing protein [Fidelibacterota bacterium]|nr:MAG: LamG domain-containing protein [Candidatus Neomarinimicrobiota bacterium]
MIPHSILFALLISAIACDEKPKSTNSVVLHNGAYVQVTNWQTEGAPLDTTTLAVLSSDIFSLEIWAAGDTLPAGYIGSPALFTVANDQGGNEIGIARTPGDSSSIFIWIGDRWGGSYSISRCDWNNAKRFTQIVVTYDGSTVRVYGNGEALGSRTLNEDLDIGLNDAYIGADYDVTNTAAPLGNFWYGAVDEVRIWTKILPASEMSFRYRNPDKLTRNYSPSGLDDLLGLWRFNQKGRDGDIVPDGSGKGNDATLHSGTGQLGFTSKGA